jgi:hypothetical protein
VLSFSGIIDSVDRISDDYLISERSSGNLAAFAAHTDLFTYQIVIIMRSDLFIQASKRQPPVFWCVPVYKLKKSVKDFQSPFVRQIL